jgi:hypothetical protein
MDNMLPEFLGYMMQFLCFVPMCILSIIHGRAVLKNIPNVLPIEDNLKLKFAEKRGKNEVEDLLKYLSSPDRLNRLGRRYIDYGITLLVFWLLVWVFQIVYWCSLK